MKDQNNPLNIRYNESNHWAGQIAPSKGFCKFDTLEHGIRAAAIIMCRSYRRRGIDTLDGVVSHWAPKSENPTAHYIAFVRNKARIWRREALRQPAQYALILWAMWWFEQGKEPSLSPAEILTIINHFKIKLL